MKRRTLAAMAFALAASPLLGTALAGAPPPPGPPGVGAMTGYRYEMATGRLPPDRHPDSSVPAPFDPYANESDVLSIGGDLTVENRLDRVTLIGSVDLTLDRQGRRKAEALKALLDRVAASLAAGEPLPEKVGTTVPVTVDNPFE